MRLSPAAEASPLRRAPVAFVVPGLPRPKGSVVAFRGFRTGRVVVKADAAGLKRWQSTVRLAAAVALRGAGVRLERSSGVRLVVVFVLPRPLEHVGAGGLVRAKFAGALPAVKPDIDKLLRGLLDGLTGAGYVDDAEVLEVRAVKRYAAAGEGAGAEVSIGWA